MLSCNAFRHGGGLRSASDIQVKIPLVIAPSELLA